MATPSTARLVLEVMRRHVPDDGLLQALVAGLEMTLGAAKTDRATKTLFAMVASELRGSHGHQAPVLPVSGKWANRGQKSWS